MNTLLYLLEKYPDLPWDYERLSRNPNISFEYIKNKFSDKSNVNLYDNRNVNLDKKWDWYAISYKVTYKEFINNQELPWDIEGLSENQNIPLEYIKNNLDKDWIWHFISSRVTYEEFINNKTLSWDIEGLSKNPNIPLQYIKNELSKNLHNILDEHWIWCNISSMVTYEDFINNPELPWVYGWITKNIPLGYIKNNLYKRWSWYDISERVTYKEFIDNQELPWIYDSLSKNSFIPLEYIKNNLDKNWNWFDISQRVAYEEFINNQYLPWNYYQLSSNKNIPFEYIKNNFNEGWAWNIISERVTYEDFINNPKLSWNYKGLSDNLFDYESRILTKKIMNIIINDEKYIAKVYNPNRMRSYKSICELEELKTEFGWTDEEFNKYVK